MATRAQKVTKEERENARKKLAELVRPGMTVYTILRHVSASGMSRVIDLAITQEDAGAPAHKSTVDIRRIGWLVAQAYGYSYDRDRQGVKVQGCGMDMGFHLVYNLGRELFPNGGDLSLSPRESQERRAGETRETDGGYLLRHQWL